MSYTKVLAFDIGIKNLAFCILENKTNILALNNCSILEPVDIVKCHMCSNKALYTAGDKVSCKRHIPSSYKILPELNTKKTPSIKILKEIVKLHKCTTDGYSRKELLYSLSKRFTFNFEQPKQENASKLSLEKIHDALISFVKSNWNTFSGCTHVLLENQPVFKNPHMKSVQVLLFATIRSIYLEHGETPKYSFVHAKKKVSNAPKGDEGYSERKNKSEERINSMLQKSLNITDDLYNIWAKSKKKSDMADAVCMCVDFTNNS